ncbi:MAG: CBS domain-containing protein [Rhodocyclaceae bacterium]|nr:CBS domain-containing protein [Rhodocyclaceae bacterium]MCB1964031.1 CBS domain-containing protein [Rhodocyclaceae bacterium]
MRNRKIADVIKGQTLIFADTKLSIREAAKKMSAAGVGAILVVTGEKLVGIFTERDALKRVLAAGTQPDNVRLDEVMTPDPMTITPDRPLGHALHMMFEGGYRHVPVVEAGRPVGMVSARDALGAELEAFEDELTRRNEINEIL